MDVSNPLPQVLLFGGLAFAVTVAASVLLVVLVPRDFLISLESRKKPAGRKGFVTRILRNAAGWLLVVAGVILSLPGIPGPGILVLLVGLFLVDFPGKKKLQRKILGSSKVTRPANRLRRLFHKAPLAIPES